MSMTIEVARRILEACKQRANELRSPVSIAIVDSGGHLVLFERMMAPYGWATGNISLAKAATAVMFNQSTDSVARWGSEIPGFASSMASMTNGRFIMAAGGWPIRVNGATVGGIGVSGGNAPGRDDDIARAGLAAVEGSGVPMQPRPQTSYSPVQPAMQPSGANYMSQPPAQPIQQSAQSYPPVYSQPLSPQPPPQSSPGFSAGTDQEQGRSDEQIPYDDYNDPRGGQQ